MHKYRQGIPLGKTSLSEIEVTDLLAALSDDWLGGEYSLLRRNCCHFADALCRRLGVGGIPDWVRPAEGERCTFAAPENTLNTT